MAKRKYNRLYEYKADERKGNRYVVEVVKGETKRNHDLEEFHKRLEEEAEFYDCKITYVELTAQPRNEHMYTDGMRDYHPLYKFRRVKHRTGMAVLTMPDGRSFLLNSVYLYADLQKGRRVSDFSDNKPQYLRGEFKTAMPFDMKRMQIVPLWRGFADTGLCFYTDRPQFFHMSVEEAIVTNIVQIHKHNNYRPSKNERYVESILRRYTYETIKNKEK